LRPNRETLKKKEFTLEQREKYFYEGFLLNNDD